MPVGFPQAILTGNNSKIALKNSRFPPVLRNTNRQLMPSAPSVSWSTNAPGGSTTGSITGTVLTITGSPSFTILPGMTPTGAGVAAGTVITSNGTGTGGNGTYNLNKSQTVGSESLTFSATVIPATDGGQGSSVGRVNGGAPFTYYRGANVQVKGSVYPGYSYCGFACTNLATVASPNMDAVIFASAFIHTGRFVALWVLGNGENVQVKVNDYYLTFTKQGFAADGNGYYGLIDFGSTGKRRIELLTDGGKNFGGVYVGANDIVQRAQVRGPRVICVTDSFGAGSNAGASFEYWPALFAEYMQWDDVWTSGVGGTGFLANSSGNKCTYRQRLATDVIPFSPDIVILQASVNDAGQTGAAIAAEAALCVQALQAALPQCLIAVTSPPLVTGNSYNNPTGLLSHRAAIQTMCQSNGAMFLDVQQYPFPSGYVPHTTTLTSSCSANATTLFTASSLKAGAAYTFADGSIVNVISASGGAAPFTNTIDTVHNAQSNGALLTEIGNCPWTGSGKVGSPTGVGSCDFLEYSDGIHPTSCATAMGDGGSGVIGEVIGYTFINQLYSN